MAQPVKTFRVRGVSASVFENEAFVDGQPSRFFKVNLQRTFKQDGQFKHNSSFSRDDLPVAMHVLKKAWEFVLESEAASSVEE